MAYVAPKAAHEPFNPAPWYQLVPFVCHGGGRGAAQSVCRGAPCSAAAVRTNAHGLDRGDGHWHGAAAARPLVPFTGPDGGFFLCVCAFRYRDHWDDSWPAHEPRPVAWNSTKEQRCACAWSPPGSGCQPHWCCVGLCVFGRHETRHPLTTSAPLCLSRSGHASVIPDNGMISHNASLVITDIFKNRWREWRSRLHTPGPLCTHCNVPRTLSAS